ncbi:hypothetical protein AB0B00_11975, partial [Microbispora hainanensis]
MPVAAQVLRHASTTPGRIAVSGPGGDLGYAGSAPPGRGGGPRAAAPRGFGGGAGRAGARHS